MSYITRTEIRYAYVEHECCECGDIINYREPYQQIMYRDHNRGTWITIYKCINCYDMGDIHC